MIMMIVLEKGKMHHCFFPRLNDLMFMSHNLYGLNKYYIYKSQFSMHSKFCQKTLFCNSGLIEFKSKE